MSVLDRAFIVQCRELTHPTKRHLLVSIVDDEWDAVAVCCDLLDDPTNEGD